MSAVVAAKLDALRRAAARHYDATLRSESVATQATGEALQKAEAAVSEVLPQHRTEVRSLLRDPHPGVRLSAALCLLPHNDAKALWVLRFFAWLRTDPIGLIAGWRLRERRKALSVARGGA